MVVQDILPSMSWDKLRHDDSSGVIMLTSIFTYQIHIPNDRIFNGPIARMHDRKADFGELLFKLSFDFSFFINILIRGNVHRHYIVPNRLGIVQCADIYSGNISDENDHGISFIDMQCFLFFQSQLFCDFLIMIMDLIKDKQ